MSSHLLLHLISIPDEDSPPGGHDHDRIHHRPSAALVPIPAYFFAESIKKQLPATPYRSFLERNRSGKAHHDHEDDDHHKGSVNCIICLDRIEESDEVRVPLSCCHVFHRECLDVWIDQGQGTCPLCRSKLLSSKNHHHHHDNHDQDDQWRRERLIYLSGEDFLFGDE
ncbi:RING-H2 finger protein ATL1 [Morus notabilis]|uniref:RING-H2 finger protein ATL1 n=1 Tax=Morus notabilis TaxID=981085 RepID=W9RA11_9ROSA|nr:RING-H2 finger protein ATL1 [Morus notabilis]